MEAGRAWLARPANAPSWVVKQSKGAASSDFRRPVPVERCVEPAERHELFVSALLDEPRVRDELPLAEREPGTAFLQLRLVTVLEPKDELMGSDRVCGGDDVLRARVGPAEGDVFAHGSREEEALLRHDPKLAAQGFLWNVSQVVAVDRDP